MYSDVVGPGKCTSFGNSKYFVTLLNEYSTYSLVRFIRRKSTAEDPVAEMINVLENALNKKPLSICLIQRKSVNWSQTNKGGECMEKLLQAWLIKRSINQKLTPAYSPESNGKRERLIQTPTDVFRSEMLGARRSFPAALRAEAILFADHVRSRLRTKSCREDKTYFEFIHDYKPDLLRTHGFN